MASETVDPIDWSHPPLYTGQYPLSSTYCTVQCGLQITRLVALVSRERATFGLPDQRTACAATQCIRLSIYNVNQITIGEHEHGKYCGSAPQPAFLQQGLLNGMGPAHLENTNTIFCLLCTKRCIQTLTWHADSPFIQ